MTEASQNVAKNEEDRSATTLSGAERGSASGQAVPDTEKLRSYTRTKLAIAAQLRVLREVLKKRGSDRRFDQCEELMAKLAEDRFTLAVLGQFKRGKSSLMNAIIGHELLPVGVLPLTSAVTVLKFGPKERLLIFRKDVALPFPEEVPVERLSDYVTERGNPGNQRKLKTACLELPLPFLRRGLEFVDTPGVGSAIQANTATTYSFLPECDAVLFVTSVDTPFTAVELEFLRDIRQHVRKIFFIINKTDLLTEGEREEVLQFIHRTLGHEMDATDLRFFPVSSRAGLAAKLADDAASYANSGLKNLEEALGEFLTSEKASVFLNAIVDRALRMAQQESVEVELRRRAHQTPQPVLLERLEALTERFRQHAASREQILERIHQHVIQEATNLIAAHLQEFLVAQQKVFSRNLKRWLAHCRWRFARPAAQRAASHLLRVLKAKTRQWLSSQSDRLNFAADPIVMKESRLLQANVGEIPRLAGELFGVRVAEHLEAESVPLCRLKVEFEPPFLVDLHWQPRVTGLRAWLPVLCTRRWLQRLFAREWTDWMVSYCTCVLTIVRDAVSAAFQKWSNDVGARTTEAGVRVLAAITHEQAPSPVAHHGVEPDHQDAQWSEAALASVHQRFGVLRSDILALSPDQILERPGDVPIPAAETAEDIPTPLPVKLPAPRRIETNLATDLRTRGCAVCEHLARFAFDFLSQWQYALYTDEKAQQDFAAELGFCPLHTWQLEAVSSPVGASVGYAKLAEKISRVIAQAPRTQAAGRALTGLVRGGRNCRLCQLSREAESQYIEQLASFIRGREGRNAFSHSHGLCVRHLGLLVSASMDAQSVEFLLAEAARRFEELAEDMQSYGMKTESLRRFLSNKDEDDAYLRAMIHIAGGRSVCCPWNKDVEI